MKNFALIGITFDIQSAEPQRLKGEYRALATHPTAKHPFQ
jgi:hypothetical protein